MPIKIKSILRNQQNTDFSLYIKKGIFKKVHGTYNFRTTLLGDHNILNAAGAIAASLIAGVPMNQISKSLNKFEGEFVNGEKTGQ